MDERTKYILIGVAIGIVLGLAIFYVLMSSGIARPMLFGMAGRAGGFRGPTGTIPNFTQTG